MREWISVKDRMPNGYEEVIVWPFIDSYGTKFSAEYHPNLGWKYFLHTDYICDYQDINHDITHWMPLPNSPEEQTK